MKKEKIVLTTMCLVRDKDKALFQLRTKKDWPGLTLPGGKVKENEKIDACVKREIKEECNISLISLKFKGIKEWFYSDVRDIAFIYYCDEYDGEIKDSREGHLLFLTRDKMKEYPLSQDIEEIVFLALEGEREW